MNTHEPSESVDLIALAHVRELAATGRAAEIRRGARLSQSELAHALGTTAASISRWENGRRVPRGQALDYAKILSELVSAPR